MNQPEEANLHELLNSVATTLACRFLWPSRSSCFMMIVNGRVRIHIWSWWEAAAIEPHDGAAYWSTLRGAPLIRPPLQPASRRPISGMRSASTVNLWALPGHEWVLRLWWRIIIYFCGFYWLTQLFLSCVGLSALKSFDLSKEKQTSVLLLVLFIHYLKNRIHLFKCCRINGSELIHLFPGYREIRGDFSRCSQHAVID